MRERDRTSLVIWGGETNLIEGVEWTWRSIPPTPRIVLTGFIIFISPWSHSCNQANQLEADVEPSSTQITRALLQGYPMVWRHLYANTPLQLSRHCNDRPMDPSNLAQDAAVYWKPRCPEGPAGMKDTEQVNLTGVFPWDRRIVSILDLRAIVVITGLSTNTGGTGYCINGE